MRPQKRRLLLLLCLIPVFVFWLSTVGIVFYGTYWPRWLGAILAAGWVLGSVKGLMDKAVMKQTLSWMAVLSLLIWLSHLSLKPSNHRQWVAEQRHIPKVTFDERNIIIDNFRRATYRKSPAGNVELEDVQWLTRRFNLDELTGVDFVVVPFDFIKSAAHTFLTFKFSNGLHLCLSVEIRKEEHESYSSLAGLFRNFEIMYVIGEERDIIALRSHYRNNDTYLYPIRANRDVVEKMLLSMLQQADQLNQEPEFYNSLTNTCNSNIVSHLEKIIEDDFSWHPGVYLPGLADVLAHSMGIIDFDGTLEQARERFKIKNFPDVILDEATFSRQLRQSHE